MALSTLEAEIVRAENTRRLYTFLLLILALATIVAGFIQAESMNSGSLIKGFSQFFDYPGGIVEETIAKSDRFIGLLIGFLPALLETLNIAAVATLLGGFFAVVLSSLSTRNLDVWPPVVPIVRRVMDFLRAFPELVIALFLIFVLGGSPVPAMIAVALHTAGALGKLFSEVNENIDPKPIEGLKACGARWLQRYRYAVLPQVSPNYLSYWMLRFEINVRASAILGYVGAGGIGAELKRTIGWGQGQQDQTAAIFVLLFLTIVAIDQTSSYLRNRLIGRGETRRRLRQRRMSFFEAIGTAFVNFNRFSGRASRSEYWWFYLYIALIVLALIAIGEADPSLRTAGVVAAAAILPPFLAVSWRRLHDVGLAGWWALGPLALQAVAALLAMAAWSAADADAAAPHAAIAVGVASVAASLALTLALIRPSQPGANAYGPERDNIGEPHE